MQQHRPSTNHGSASLVSRAALVAAPMALLAWTSAGCSEASESDDGEIVVAAPAENEAEPAPVEAGSRRPLPPVDGERLPVIQAELGVPPQAAPRPDRDYPAKVVVNLEVIEQTQEIADGARYTFWTFGGTVPGPMIRVRRGDVVELRLANHPDNTMPHNIDLHAVTGPGGGATSTFTAPGHQTQFSFRALHSGAYIYHCATAPVGMHVANGMYGLIVVDPEEGFPEVDQEYYVVQGDFYTEGDFRAAGDQPFDMQRAIREDASYVLFNGRDGALVGDGALQARAGDRVRIFFGNGGPNLVSSFHVIGEIFDRVFMEGGTRFNEDVQTTLVPAGGSAIVDFSFQVPGTYVLVDHSIFRAFNKGALGMIRVEGDDDLLVYSGQEVDETYLGDRSEAATDALTAAAAEGGDTLEARIRRGEATFMGTCSTCHGRDGAGVPNVFPPLARADYLMQDRQRAIDVVLSGLTGPVTVNGTQYNGVMPGFPNLTDHEIADVLTYARNSFGNRDMQPIANEDVARARAAMPQTAAAGHP